MYWPTAAARILSVPPPIDNDPVIRIRPSRRANLFATITETSIGVWDVRPSVLQAATLRSKESLERWGTNIDVFWATDGHGIIVLTSTSHLLLYSLIPTGEVVYEANLSAPAQNATAGDNEILTGWELKSTGVAFVMGRCTGVLPQPHNLLLTLQHPPAILSVPYPIPQQLVAAPGSHFPPLPLDGETEEQVECEMWDLEQAKAWMAPSKKVPGPVSMGVMRLSGLPVMYSLITDDGRVYAMYNSAQLQLFQGERRKSGSRQSSVSSQSAGPSSKFTGQIVYPPPPPADGLRADMEVLGIQDADSAEPLSDKAIDVSINARLGLVAVGTESGMVNVIVLPPTRQPARFSHQLDLKKAASLRVKPGAVTTLAWTSDGYALAVGYERGWAVWSMGGRLDGYSVYGQEDEDEGVSADGFMNGVSTLFWAPGNLDLFMQARGEPERIYVMPFVKSATTGQHSPDNTRYAFLQMDDRVLVYRGADQPDMSVINPESDVWQHIHIPNVYIASNWPIRYASISSDGRFIAVAGRRGLTHYSAASGRWKLFGQEREERAFTVRGGLLWFHHVLIAAVEVDKSFQIRLYSRDLDLSSINVLHTHPIPSPVLVMTLLGNSLLVYTADSMLYHFLILPTRDSIRIQLCGSISFRGLIVTPARVRALSWLIPEAQKRLGDPADDLIVATIIFLVDGRLVLLRPRRAGTDEVRYDMQVLADRIESYWTHLHGVGTLENSLWGYDGRSMRVWLDALTIEATKVNLEADSYENVQESINLRLDFYPLSILMDKGIIIGVEYEPSTRSLPFALFKLQTGTHLFLPPFLRYHLGAKRLKAALAFAANYAGLVYFGHALEVLLHSVLEDTVDARESSARSAPLGLDSHDSAITDADIAPTPTHAAITKSAAADEMVTDLASPMTSAFPPHTESSPAASPGGGTLALVATFLDHFPESLDVVVGCARKTELEHWSALFDVVGRPRALYERCLANNALRTAASYLLVMHTLEEADDAADTVRLLRLAMRSGETQLCKELLRFLRSIDESGTALRAAIAEVGILDAPSPGSRRGSSSVSPRSPLSAHSGSPASPHSPTGGVMAAQQQSLSSVGRRMVSPPPEGMPVSSERFI